MCEERACGSTCVILGAAGTAVTGCAFVLGAALAVNAIEAAVPAALMLLRAALVVTGVLAAAAGGAGVLWWLRRRRGRPVWSRRVRAGVGVTAVGTSVPLALAVGVPLVVVPVALVALGLAGASAPLLRRSGRLAVVYWPAVQRPALPALVRRELPAAAPLAIEPTRVIPPAALEHGKVGA